MTIGITIKPTIGIGDALQFSSLPENYFRATGKTLVDLSEPWFFDHNPYVVRKPAQPPEKSVELWNFSPRQYTFPVPRRDAPRVYLSNAEIHAGILGVPAVVTRPRLYRYEDVPFEKREIILLHTHGRSHGELPYNIVEHVIAKYGRNRRLFQIGLPNARDYGIPRIDTKTLWDLAKVISECRMLIAVDSGPAWIGACFPDVIVKKVRLKPTVDRLKDWVPLAIDNIHSHWDDRCHQIFNPSNDDVGFTMSYRRI